MPVTGAERCPHCGSELPNLPAEGLCPACLLKEVLAGEAEPAPEESPEEDGQRYGPYTTVRILGEGGMGIVYLARQEQPIHRTVALKVIKPGMDSRQVIARFESERQALALMDHPHIARVFDAGATPDGRPYFAMEYVPGTPLHAYCDDHRLTIAERLELYSQVCLAVHHAHQKGIIHRDLKPSNVLVEVQDGKPVPKVIDFGVAKATHQRLTERTVFTEAGVLLGTPEYMSPEQAAMADHQVDASTDIYSLGVMLYELLVGVLPFDVHALRRAGYFALQRTICEQEPPPPGTRLKALGPAAEGIARRRRTDLHSLERQVRGDLGWIVMRALEKDRSRRYASASELAVDIAHHLRDEPVLAVPPTRAYRLGKFVRKHRLGVGAAAAIGACLLVGAVTSTALYFRAERQRDIAERQAYQANLANADALIESGDVDTARERLFQCPPRLRGWEWRLLYALSDTSVATLRATGDPIPAGEVGSATFAFNPAGTRLYFHMRRTVHAWEMPSWKPAADYGVFGPIVGMSQDGSRIVARALHKGEPDLLILDTGSGTRIATPHGHSGVLTAAFNATADRVATGSADGSVRLWDAGSGKLLASRGPSTVTYRYPRIAFSPDGRFFVSTHINRLRLFDARNGRLLHRINCGLTIFAVVFSPDSKRLATADGTGAIRIWNVGSGRAELSWNEVTAVWAAAFSPDGSVLVTGTQTGGVRAWDAASGSVIATLTGPDNSVHAVAFSPDGNWILAGCAATGGIWIWNARTYGGQLLGRSVQALAVSPDGARIAAADLEQSTVLDTASGRVLQEGLPGGRALAFDARGDRLALGSDDGVVRIVDIRSRSVLFSLSTHAGVQSVAFSPDGRYLASGNWGDSTAHIWDSMRGNDLATINVQTPVYAVAFSPEGRLLATGSGPAFEGALQLWEVPSGRLFRRVLPPPGALESVWAVAFSPRGDRLASGEEYSAHVRIHQTQSGRLASDLAGHADGPVVGLAFSPDGRLLASGAYDNTVRLWDTSTFELVFTLHRPAKPPGALAFSPDGTRLYASYGGPLRVWSTSSAYPVEQREFVARLQREHPLMADVWLMIGDEATLDAGQRRSAQRLCEWSLEYDQVLRGQLWGRAIYAPGSAQENKLLLRRAEATYAALPWSVDAWTILGAAQYRNGLYEEAVRTLARASAVACDDPRADALLAMAHFRLGQAGKAREALGRARLLTKDAAGTPQHDGAALIAEAEALLPQAR